MYKLAAMSTALTGVLNAIALVLGLFFAEVLPFAFFAVASLLLAKFLFSEKRMAAWCGFFVLLVCVVWALMGVNSGGYAPDWIFYAIAAMGVVSAVFLFGILWQPKSSVVKQSSASAG